MTPSKKPKKPWKPNIIIRKKKRVDKQSLYQIEAEARELGYKFKSGPPLVGKAKP